MSLMLGLLTVTKVCTLGGNQTWDPPVQGLMLYLSPKPNWLGLCTLFPIYTGRTSLREIKEPAQDNSANKRQSQDRKPGFQTYPSDSKAEGPMKKLKAPLQVFYTQIQIQCKTLPIHHIMPFLAPPCDWSLKT